MIQSIQQGTFLNSLRMCLLSFLPTFAGLLFVAHSLGGQEVKSLTTLESEVSTYVSDALQKGLDQHPVWRNLLHYKEDIWGQVISQVDGKDFFLDDQGKSNPKKELIATIKGIFQPFSKKDYHPLCMFPARMEFLAANTSIPIAQFYEDIKCKYLKIFLDNLNPKGIAVVFSSYYLGNSGSAFGHTFLRIINRKNTNKQDELLDYGVGYAANPTTNNPILYPVYGIAGFFNGVFTSVPYYYKIREYNDYEARDLWSYEINFTEDETNMVVKHLWELGRTYFYYYFFTENCAYHLLSTLEVARPSLKLTDRLAYWVIPSDSVRVLFQVPDLVKNITYRPSLRTELYHQYNLLDPKSKDRFIQLKEGEGVSVQKEEIKPLIKAKILDAAILYQRYKINDKKRGVDDSSPPMKKNSERQKFYELLKARNSLPVKSKKIEVPLPTKELPHLGHESARFSLHFGNRGRDDFSTLIRHRFAFHDKLDASQSYPENATIEFLATALRLDYNPTRINIDHIHIIGAQSLVPLSQLDSKWGWSIGLGLRTILYRSQSVLSGYFKYGYGIAKKFKFEKWVYVLYCWADGHLLGAPPIDSPLGLGIGLSLPFGILVHFKDNLKMDLSINPTLTLPVDLQHHLPHISAEFRYGLTTNTAFGARYQRWNQDNLWFGSLFYYY